MTREEFVQKWGIYVYDPNEESDPINEILNDRSPNVPMEKRWEKACRIVMERSIVDMLYDFGCNADGIEECLKVLRGRLLNSSPIVI